MKFNIFGIVIGFFVTLPYIAAYCNGVWTFGIHRLFYISNIKTPEQAAILIFDRHSKQFKLDITRDNITFVLKTGYFDINLFIPWVQVILGEKKTKVILQSESPKQFETKHGKMTVYKARSYTYYNYFRLVKFRKTLGWTYLLIEPDGYVDDVREHQCITNKRRVCETHSEAAIMLTEFIDCIRGTCAEITELNKAIDKLGEKHV